MTVTVTAAGTTSGAIFPRLALQLEEHRALYGATHDVIDATTATVTYNGPMRQSGTLQLLMATQADARSVLALAEGRMHITDTSVSPTLDLTVRVSSATMAPTATASGLWLVTLEWLAS